MPKKRSSIYSKPSSSVHPSLITGSKDTSAPTSNSVNDRIQQLRLEQNATGSKPFVAPPSHTVHPSLREILQVPDAPPPRLRPGLRVTGGRRRPAGPPAPVSWLQAKPPEKRKSKTSGSKHGTSNILPGCQLPLPGSLLEMTLKGLAEQWDFHSQYDQYYLATIPVRYKEFLLYYITRLSPNGIDRSGLEILFLDETELEGATGAEDLRRLDFSHSIGRSLPLRALRSFFTHRLPPGTATNENIAAASTVPEDWESTIPLSPSLPRFHMITHLSLSHPPYNISWSAFLSVILPHLPQGLTHLSLAFWPLPTQTPNSLTAYTTTPAGSVQAGGSNFYTAFDHDWTESASILRRVAKSTPSLHWLDLTGCWPWMQTLAHPGFDWAQLWPALETVVAGQGWMPDCFSHHHHPPHRPRSEQMGPASQWREAYGLTGPSGATSTSSRCSMKEVRDLVEWAHVESLGFRFEKFVKEEVAAAMEMRASPSRDDRHGGDARLVNDDNDNRNDNDDDDSDDWNTAGVSQWRKKPLLPPTATARTHGVRFERGWDAGWIRDAVWEIVRFKGTFQECGCGDPFCRSTLLL